MGWLQKFNPFLGSETKTAVSAPINAAYTGGLFGALFSVNEITPWQAWGLYNNSSSLSKVIDLIADEVARLKPQIRIDGEVVEDSPILTFLNNPGFNRTRQRLIKELAVQYLVTGTAYLNAYGNTGIADVPLAVDVMQTFKVSTFQAPDMWPMTYQCTDGTTTQNFQRTSDPRDFRWLGVEDGNGSVSLSEIVPIYDMEGPRRGIGLPRLNSIKYDVELRLKGIMHNSALMDNNARPSGVLSVKHDIEEDTVRAIEADLNAKLSGPANAGRVLVTAGGETDFTSMSQSAKDMDFAKLVELVEDSIVARYNVPITLFRTTAQTNNNYKTAFDFFYNLAALPCFEVIYSGIAQMLSRRLGYLIEITPDPLSNPVLAGQKRAEAIELYNAHLVSRNEARTLFGMENVLGGDTIYGSISDVPQAEDYFTDHGINDPSADNSREAYHDARPENDPIQHAEAESEARARGAARGNPDANKPKPTAKKPAKGKKGMEMAEATGVLIEFAKYMATKKAA